MQALRACENRLIQKSLIAVFRCFSLSLALATPVCGDEASKESSAGEIQWSVESSHNILPPPGQNFWVRLRLRAPELKQGGRDPLNLSAVFAKPFLTRRHLPRT